MSKNTNNQDLESPLDIVRNPNNYHDSEKYLNNLEDETVHSTKEEKEEKPKKGMSRRDMLRLGGAAAATASVLASGAAGFATGRDTRGYTGIGDTYYGKDAFFNREPFRVEIEDVMKPVGTVTRPHWFDMNFERTKVLRALIVRKQWNPGMTAEEMPGELGDYYRARPERYEAMIKQFEQNANRAQWWEKEGHKKYAITGAYNTAFNRISRTHSGLTIPEEPQDVYENTGVEQPPEKWDYRNVNKRKMEFKSPAHASKIIKRITHLFGMSIVGICKFDERFMYTGLMRGMKDRGHDNWGDKVPAHWKSVIIFGVPMEWESMYSALGYQTSQDSYMRSRLAAGLLEQFLQALGYPARAQYPGSQYEIMLNPFLILAGIGEESRSGMVMVPEFGTNFRPAAVVTDMEFEYDKPISVNMAHFCKKCKICADTCPSGAISHEDEPTAIIRGFKRWPLDDEKCYGSWQSSLNNDGLGCGVCHSVCPYTRKNTWIHKISREIDPRDPTGLFASGLLAMQHNFFKYPAGEEFRAEWDGGREANYHNPPWWARSEEFLKDVMKDWEYDGMY